MSEVMRDLVVALSLDSSNFVRNLRSINAQIRQAESEFRLAGAGVDGFGSTLSGQQAKADSLRKTMDLQTLAVQQYQMKLQQATAREAQTRTNYNTYVQKLSQARTAHDALGKTLTETNAEYERLKGELGESDPKVEALAKKVEELSTAYVASGEEVKKLTGQVQEEHEAMQEATTAVARAQTQLNDAESALRSTTSELESTEAEIARLSNSWVTAGEAMTAFAEKAGSAGQSLENVGSSLTENITKPILNLGRQAVEASVSYESAFAAVRKTVVATEEEYQALSDGIEEMSTRLATGAESIAETVEAAAHLGIENRDLLDFTETMLQLQNTTNLTATEAGTNMARFANIMGYADKSAEEMTDYWARLGSTIVSLGMQNATTESEILEMSMRIAGAGRQVGMTEQEVLGVSAALASLGINAQAGGTSFSKALMKMQVAVETGNEDLLSFAAVSGMTAEQFAAVWKRSPVEAFQAFILGLSGMSDEETSAIAILEEMGITEIRLRDTILRTTNATELFARTQAQANAAFQSTDTLTTKAAQRLGTVEAKTANLKNQVSRLMRTFGNDALPIIGQITDKANELIERFVGMDESTRHSIETYALIAAAIGPAILVIGKLVTGISTIAATAGKAMVAFGNFRTAVSAAGGGLQGLATAMGPAATIGATVALTAALILGVNALVDYATGAKKAREAVEGMNQAAKNWSDHQAETFYSRDGLTNLGLTADAFDRFALEGENLLKRLDKVWAATGQKTDRTVSDMTSRFAQLTDKTRSSLMEIQENAAQFGMDDMVGDMQKDLDLLDHIDDKISTILTSAKDRDLTAGERADLEALLTQRQDIEIRYHLTEGDSERGFDAIRRKIEAEERRAAARGETAGLDVYKDAVVASAQGLSDLNRQLDEEYDQQYRLLQLQYTGAEFEQKKAELDSRYAGQRQDALKEYADSLARYMKPVWESEGNQAVSEQVEELYRLAGAYSDALSHGENGADILEQMKELSDGMDESAFTEYYTMLTQISDLMAHGMSKEEVETLFGIDLDEEMGRFAELEQFLQDHQDTLGGLADMFGKSLPEEIIKIAADLDLTTAQETWGSFASNPSSILPDVIVQKYGNAPGVAPDDLVSGLKASVAAYESTGDASQLVTGLLATVSMFMSEDDPSQALVGSLAATIASYQNGEITPDSLVSSLQAVITSYADQGAPEELVNGLAAIISAYSNDPGADPGTLVASLMAFVSGYDNANGVSPSPLVSALLASVSGYLNTGDPNAVVAGLMATVAGYASSEDPSEALVGGLAATISSYQNGDISPEDLVSSLQAVITSYADQGAPEELVNGLMAIVTGFGSDPDADPDSLVSSLFACISDYDNANGVSPNPLVSTLVASIVSYLSTGDPEVGLKDLLGVIARYTITAATPKVYSSLTLDSYSRAELDRYIQRFPLVVKSRVRLSDFTNTPADLLNDPAAANAAVWKNGVQVPLTADIVSKLKPSDLVVLDEDGRMHIIVVPEYSGTETEMKTTAEEMNTDLWLGLANGLEMIEALNRFGQPMIDHPERFRSIFGADTRKQRMEEQARQLWYTPSGSDKTYLDIMGGLVGNFGLAMKNGGTVPAEALQQLYATQQLLETMTKLGTNDEVRAQLAADLQSAGFEGVTADNVAEQLNTMLTELAQANGYEDTGEMVAAGVGAGMAQYNYTSDAETTVSNAETAVESAAGINSPAARFIPAGQMIAAGIGEGLVDFDFSSYAAIVADNILTAVRNALGIHSPSELFADRVGALAAAGIGEGFLRELPNQAAIIGNAVKYLSDDARASNLQTTSNTYNQTYDDSVSLNVEEMVMRGDVDAQALAQQIADIGKRSRRARGSR